MVTASHNSADYNVYKVYWTDGGQAIFPHDQALIAEMIKIIDPHMVKKAPSLSHELIQKLGDEIDHAYIQKMIILQNYPESNQREGSFLKIVYTSLHGTGITMVPKALKAWGFENITYVDSQIIPDGLFPTVQAPNPEEPQAIKMGAELLCQIRGDILIATDADSDRLGVAVYHQGRVIQLNGNQIAVLCLEHVCRALILKNKNLNGQPLLKLSV